MIPKIPDNIINIDIKKNVISSSISTYPYFNSKNKDIKAIIVKNK